MTKVLMLGDSITHGTELSQFIDFAQVEHFAVPGYSTDDVARQLPGINFSEFDVVSLLIGTNDFGNPEIDRDGIDVGLRVKEIAVSIAASGVPLVLHHILPRGPQFSARIREANIMIAGVELEHEQIRVVNSWPTLSRDDYLRPKYLLNDGFDVHLNEDGYRVWAVDVVASLQQLLK